MVADRPPRAKAVECYAMSTPPPNTPQQAGSTGAVGTLVPAYLVLIGIVLLAGFVYLAVNYGDELFVAFLAAAGGVTMIVTAVLWVVMGGSGSR